MLFSLILFADYFSSKKHLQIQGNISVTWMDGWMDKKEPKTDSISDNFQHISSPLFLVYQTIYLITSFSSLSKTKV